MKATTQNQVIDYLQWTTDQYEERLFLAMYMWCQVQTQYPSVIQQLLANAAINRWFIHEYSKCEANFIKIAEVMPNNVKQLEGHYKACTSHMQTIYPAPLVDQATRNRDFSNQYLINAPVFYSN